MLQQRAKHKYISPGLWTSTVVISAMGDQYTSWKRRLQEEMGFTTELKEVTSFIYKAPFENGLTEHEFDHILLGHYEDDPVINLNRFILEMDVPRGGKK